MKRIFSNGLLLKVWDVTLVMQVGQSDKKDPLPLIDEIMTEDEARDYMRKILGSGLYVKKTL